MSTNFGRSSFMAMRLDGGLLDSIVETANIMEINGMNLLKYVFNWIRLLCSFDNETLGEVIPLCFSLTN